MAAPHFFIAAAAFLVALILHGERANGAYDFSKLQGNPLRVQIERRLGKPKRFEGGGSSLKFWGRDHLGRRGKVRVADGITVAASGLFAEVAYTAVADALGIPHVPSYLASLPKSDVGLAGGASRVLVTFQPFIDFKSHFQYLDEKAGKDGRFVFDEATITQMTEVRLLAYLFGVWDIDCINNANVGFSAGKYVAIDVERAFSMYFYEGRDRQYEGGKGFYIRLPLKWLISNYAYGSSFEIRNLAPQDQRQHALAISRFISKVEMLSDESLHGLLDPIFFNLRTRAHSAQDYWEEFQMRRLTLRASFLEYFRDIVLFNDKGILSLIGAPQAIETAPMLDEGCGKFLRSVKVKRPAKYKDAL